MSVASQYYMTSDLQERIVLPGLEFVKQLKTFVTDGESLKSRVQDSKYIMSDRYIEPRISAPFVNRTL